MALSRKSLIALLTLAFLAALIAGPFAVLPALALFTGLLAASIAIIGGLFAWLDAGTSNTELLELGLLAAMMLAFVYWIYFVFVRPLVDLAETSATGRKGKPISDFERNYAVFISAYMLAASFFWFVFFEYEFGGNFFKSPPSSALHALLSGANILSGDYLSKLLEGTEWKDFIFSTYDPSKLRNKLIVLVTQSFVTLGILKSVVAFLKTAEPKAP